MILKLDISVGDFITQSAQIIVMIGPVHKKIVSFDQISGSLRL
jgi:hypothetical protein